MKFPFKPKNWSVWRFWLCRIFHRKWITGQVWNPGLDGARCDVCRRVYVWDAQD